MSNYTNPAEVQFRTLILFVTDEDTRALASRASKAAGRMDILQGSTLGEGFCRLRLLCTPGELSDLKAACVAAGLPAYAIGSNDAPRRPGTWSSPLMRDNWTGQKIEI